MGGEKMNVLFLDYDGVINTSKGTYEDGNKQLVGYYTPKDGMVNNYYAVKNVSKFCIEYGYVIVVTSNWSRFPNYKECLTNSGLDPSVSIIGKTAKVFNANHVNFESNREREIAVFLRQNQVEKYIILDDSALSDIEMNGEIYQLSEHIVKCNPDYGFNKYRFDQAVKIHEAQG